MLPNTGQLALVVAVVYLIIFFLLGSGVFNSIIEGPGVSTRYIHCPFQVRSNDRRNDCDDNDLVHWNGWRVPAL